MSTLSMLLTALDDYTTQLTIYIEDITETLFYFSMYEETLDSEYETIFDDKMFQNSLNVFFSHSLFHLFQLEYEEKTAVQTTLLNTCAFSFINEFDFDNFKYPKHLGPEIHIWFYEPRSLKQLYVARAIKPSDYIMPESAYIDLLVFKKTIC